MYTTIRGTIYDITEFAPQHPGGEELLRLVVQKDATTLFDSYHRRTAVAFHTLASLPCVSKEDEEEGKGNIGTSLLYAELKRRVNKYFLFKDSSRGDWKMLAKSCLVLICTAVLYVWMLQTASSLLAALVGLLFAIIGLSIQHDASHGAFSSNPIINQVACFTNDIIGGSSLMWKHQHVLSHHLYPNHHDHDVDTFSNFPLLKTNPNLEHRWYFRYQHLYAPLLYCLLSMSYPIGDVLDYLRGNNHHIFLQPLRTQDKILFWLGKGLHYLLVLFLPMSICGFPTSLWSLTLPLECVGSFFLASCFVVSHNSEKIEYNTPESMDWAETQIRTSANWSIHSWLWLHVSGGLNFQIEHHLFPGICHLHYPALSQIVQQMCQEHGLPYHHFPSFWAIWKSHWNKLKQLGHRHHEN